MPNNARSGQRKKKGCKIKLHLFCLIADYSINVKTTDSDLVKDFAVGFCGVYFPTSGKATTFEANRKSKQ
jgi:hypothetical protein